MVFNEFKLADKYYHLQLGFGYALHEYDFFDSFQCFPHEAVRVYEENGVGVEIFWQQFNDKYRNLPKSPFMEELVSSINCQQKRFRLTGVEDVSDSYIESFSSGITHLESESLQFYFLVVVSLLSKPENLLDNAVDAFIWRFLMIAKDGGRGLNEFDGDAHKLVSRFLNAVYEYSDMEYEEAGEALDLFWKKYF